MGELFTGLVILGIVVLFIAAVGHGIWLILAAIVRALGGPANDPVQMPSIHEAGDKRQALSALDHQLVNLRQRDAIDEPSFQRLRGAIRDELQLLAPAVPRPAVPPPVPAAEGALLPPPPKHLPQQLSPGRTVTETPVMPSLPAASLPTPAAMQEHVAADSPSRQAIDEQPPAAKPRRTWGEVFASFMEERHLRWGELVGGLLIVCGSIALVLSFWGQISQRPFLKFFVFNGFTAGLFGLGFYAERRMKLPNTGQGMLIIGSLLVPLNFLALAAFSRDAMSLSWLTIAGEGISLAIFFFLTRAAAATLAKRFPWSLTLGALGPSLAALLARRFVDATADGQMLLAAAGLPLTFYVMATAIMLRRSRGREAISESAAFENFRVLGITTFATLLPLGLIIFRTQDAAGALQALTPLAAIAAAPALAVGLRVWRLARQPGLGAIRTAGMAIAVAGAGVILAAIALAWPAVSLVVAAALVAAAVIAVLAIAMDIPQAQVLAAAALTVAGVLTFHVGIGAIDWQTNDAAQLLSTILSGKTGWALGCVAVGLFACGGLCSALKRKEHTLWQVRAALLSAAASMIIVTVAGWGRAGDPLGVTWFHAAGAAVAFAAAVMASRSGGSPDTLDENDDSRRRIVRNGFAWAASILAWGAVSQAIVFADLLPWQFNAPWLAVFLVHATVFCGVAFVAGRLTRHQDDSFAHIVSHSAIVSLLMSCVLFVDAIAPLGNAQLALHAGWIALIALTLCFVRRSPAWFTAFQAAATVAVVFATAAWLQTAAWGSEARNLWLDPRSLQSFGIVLAAWGLGWLAVAIVLRKRAAQSEGSSTTAAALLPYLRPQWPSVDQAVRICVLLLAVGLSVYAAWPGAAQELTPRRLAAALEGVTAADVIADGVIPAVEHFEFRAMPHQHARGWGGWVLLLAATVPFLVAQWERRQIGNTLAILLAIAAFCPMVAASFESDLAVASAWRWLSAGMFLLMAIPIWLRSRLATGGTRLGWKPLGDHQNEATARRATELVLALAVAPLAIMVGYIGIAAVMHTTLAPAIRVAFPFTMLGLIVGVLVAVMIHFSSSRADNESTSTRRANAARLAAILGAAPLIALSMFTVTIALRGNPIASPVEGTFFHVIGRAVSYSVPVLVGALTVTGFAVRERSPRFAFAAGLLFNLSATAGYLLYAAKAGMQLDVVLWIRLAQINAIVSSGFAICWAMGLLWYNRRAIEHTSLPAPAVERNRHGLLLTTTMFGGILFVLPVAVGLIRLFLTPWDPQSVGMIAGVWGWSTLAVVAVAAVAYGRLAGYRLDSKAVSLASLVTAAMAVFQIARYDTGNWLAYHCLLILLVSTGWMSFVFTALRARTGLAVKTDGPRPSAAHEWAVVVPAVAAVLLALREAVSFTPTFGSHAWWSVGALANIAALFTVLAFGRLRRWPTFAAAALAAMAMTLGWWELFILGRRTVGTAFLDLVNWNIIVQGVLCVAWVALERLMERRKDGDSPSEAKRAYGCHRLVATASLSIVALQAALRLAFALDGPLAAPAWVGSMAIAWGALIAALVACGSCLWDRGARSSAPQLYVLGLAACAMTLAQFPLGPRMLLWMGTMVLAAYTILTSYLWSRRRGLAMIADRLSILRDKENEFAGLQWLVPFSTILISCVIAFALIIVLSFEETSMRIAVGQAALLQSLALGMLARGEKRSQLQTATLFTVALGAMIWGWAWLAPPQGGPFLNHAIVMTVVLAGLTALYGLGLAKFFPRRTEWTQAAAKLVPFLSVSAVGALLAVLGSEVSYFASRTEIPINSAGIATVAVSLAVLFAAAIVAAIVPGRDPLGLSDRGRMLYVYAAEGLLALLFLHVRLTMPLMFAGFLTRFWPLLVIAIAFAGVGLAEVFRRQKRLVLAEPLERTGAALPLLPALGFWLAPQGSYSLVLLSAGALYLALSAMRRSFGFGILAALAANGSLWTYLAGTQGLEFWRHPQLWMIPIALCVLVAAYLNRRQLTDGQMTSVRYLTSSTIYLSSTADIFLIGVANAPWLPLVLAALAVAGVLMGMLLRVRAFLFLGTAFLFVSLSTIIWYAAVDLHQTWLVWLTVVAAGMAILGLFALFEKKRNEVLRVFRNLREWAP